MISSFRNGRFVRRASLGCLLAMQCALVGGALVGRSWAQNAEGGPAPAPTQSPVTINVHLDQPAGPLTPIYSWFGYDEANYTTALHGRELLKELHDLSPVPVYIRVHHLLTSGDGRAELKFSSTNIYREDAQGKPIYEFTILDGIFDAYKSAGVRPMVELGSCRVTLPPTCLTATSRTRCTSAVHRLRQIQQSSQGLQQVAGPCSCHDRSPCRALRKRRSAPLVFRSLERARHRLLARHP